MNKNDDLDLKEIVIHSHKWIVRIQRKKTNYKGV